MLQVAGPPDFLNNSVQEQPSANGVQRGKRRQRDKKDLPAGMVSGLDVATKVVKNIEDIAICNLTSKDVVRHPLVQKIVQAYEEYEHKAERAKDKRRK